MPLNICVFCSSSDAIDALYFEAAAQLGALMARGGHTLVYGGGRIGLMGALARAVHEHAGRVVGVIPDSMVERELAYHGADELVVTETMRQRKATMDERSDAFLALPGGFGTLEELIEVVAHHQLKYHAKPTIILNLQGFFDPLLALFDHIIDRRFAKPRYRDSYHVVDSPTAAMAYLNGVWPRL